MSPVHAFCLDCGWGADMGLTGLPGRSLPEACLGEPLARVAVRRGVRTRRLLAARAGVFFFLGVLNRVSRRGEGA